MVDALRRAHRMLARDGYLVDIHPTDAPAVVEVGDLDVGPLDTGDASARHAAASGALIASVAARLFESITVLEFDFCTYGDTIDELRDFVAQTWRSSRIGEPTVEAARAALAAAEHGVRPRTRERVQLTTLRPLALR